MLKAGERAPEFTLPDETSTDRSLTQLLSAGAIVLYFYPADFTPGCTRQACVLRDIHAEIEGAGLRVVGISRKAPNRTSNSRQNTSCPSYYCPTSRKPSLKCTESMDPWG